MFNLTSSHLEAAHEEQFSESMMNHGNKMFGPTPQVRKTKTKVKLNNGTRFLNNPYYAGTPLARINNNTNTHQQQQYQQQVNNNNNNINSNQAIAAAFLQQHQPVQPQFFQPSQSQMNSFNQESFVEDRHDSSFIFGQQQQGFSGNNMAFNVFKNTANFGSNHSSANPSFVHPLQQVHNNNVQQLQHEHENFSFTSQNFNQQPQQPLHFNIQNQQQQQQQKLVLSSSGSSSHNTPIPQIEIEEEHDRDSFEEDEEFQQQEERYLQQQQTSKKFRAYPTGTSFVVVAFKHELCTFQCSFFVVEGDWVVVQADRGEHVGRVRSVAANPPPFHVPSQILRHANFAEISSVEANRAQEEYAARRIQEVADDLGLVLRITDTEFYSDGNKMTVFFSAKSSVDFRELQRRVFREFRRRIWLINNAEVQYRNRNSRNRK